MFGVPGKKRIRGWTGLLPLLLTAAVLLCAMVCSALVWPENSGGKLQKKGKLTVDAGNSSLGYILVKGPKGKKKLKLRVAYGKEELTYDLNKDGEYEVIPLQSGSGKYEITLYVQASGKKYTQSGKVSVKAQLEDEEAAFLCPNQFVNYTADCEVTALCESVCKGLTKETEIYDAVCKAMKSNFGYDFVKALTISAGTLPDIDGCIKKKMGVCQDLSAVMVSMLRLKGIHARLVIGYADNAYHAWVTANVDGEEKFFDPTAAVGAIKNVKNYTVERMY